MQAAENASVHLPGEARGEEKETQNTLEAKEKGSKGGSGPEPRGEAAPKWQKRPGITAAVAAQGAGGGAERGRRGQAAHGAMEGPLRGTFSTRWKGPHVAHSVLEGAQRKVGVQRPVAPRRTGQTILEEHADDGHRVLRDWSCNRSHNAPYAAICAQPAAASC